MLLGLDAIAFSTLWHSHHTDRRESLLEGMIQQQNLICLNQKSAFHTLNGPKGKTNIDVTLVSPELLGRITHWTIIPDATNSDHNILAFDLHTGTINIFNTRKDRFDENRANWPLFVSKLSDLLTKDRETIEHGTTNERAVVLTSAV